MTTEIPRFTPTPTIVGSSLGFAILLFLSVGCISTQHAYTPGPIHAWEVPPPSQEPTQVRIPGVEAPNPDARAQITLDELLVYADQNAPALHVARAQSSQGDAEVAAASLILRDNPELEIGVGGRHLASSSFLEAEVSLAQRFEVAGERGLRMETATAARALALGQLEVERWSVHVATHAFFFEALIAQKRVSAAETAVRFAQELEQIATKRIASGEDSPLTRLVAQSELALTLERLVEMKHAEAATINRLAETVGWPTSASLAISGELPPVRRTKGADVLVEMAAKRHPSLHVRSLAVAHAESEVRLQEREAWPEPTLAFTYGREGETGVEANIWLVSVGIPLPFWNQNQGEQARARVRLDVAKRSRESLYRRWRGQLERSAQHVDAAAERVEIYGAQVLPVLEQNLTLIRRAYELGEIDIHAVSQTRAGVLATQAQALDARAAYFRGLAELEGLVGTDLIFAVQEVQP